MFDPAVFPEPDVFRADRHMENYRQLGRGMLHLLRTLAGAADRPGHAQAAAAAERPGHTDDGGVDLRRLPGELSGAVCA